MIRMMQDVLELCSAVYRACIMFTFFRVHLAVFRIASGIRRWSALSACNGSVELHEHREEISQSGRSNHLSRDDSTWRSLSRYNWQSFDAYSGVCSTICGYSILLFTAAHLGYAICVHLA